MFFSRLADLNIRWKTIPALVQDALKALILQHLSGFNEQEFSNLLRRSVSCCFSHFGFFILFALLTVFQ
jgi:hypothetical protein